MAQTLARLILTRDVGLHVLGTLVFGGTAWLIAWLTGDWLYGAAWLNGWIWYWREAEQEDKFRHNGRWMPLLWRAESHAEWMTPAAVGFLAAAVI